MKRINVLLVFLFCIFFTANAQIFVDSQGNVYDQRTNKKQQTTATKQQVNKTSSANKFDKKKLEFGGDLGLQFGNYTTVNVSPQVGYRFSKNFSAGAGLGYTYYNNDYYDNDYTEHFASMNLYGTFYPINFIVLSVRPEISRMWQKYTEGQETSTFSKFVPSVVVGGGLRLGSMTAQVKYDVIQDEYSPYGNRLFYSIGYTFGF